MTGRRPAAWLAWAWLALMAVLAIVDSVSAFPPVVSAGSLTA
jgi:hypothetical protein